MDDITRKTPRRDRYENRDKYEDTGAQTRGEADRVVVERQVPAEDRPVYYPAHRSAGSRLLYYLLDILEVLLVLRLVLRLLSANAGSPFVSLIYRVTEPFIAPFRGIFTPTASGTAVIEWSTVIAMVVYALVVYALVKLVDLAANPT